jgi:hypothetical protein
MAPGDTAFLAAVGGQINIGKDATDRVLAPNQGLASGGQRDLGSRGYHHQPSAAGSGYKSR